MRNHIPHAFYLRKHIDPIEYGFVEVDYDDRQKAWKLQVEAQHSAIYILKSTRQIFCNGVSTACLAVLFQIAEKGGIEIVSPDDPKKVPYMVTAEEIIAIEKMRGHCE